MIGDAVDDLDPHSLALAAERTAAALARSATAADPAARTHTIGGRRYTSEDLAASARHVASVARSEPDAAGVTRRLARECSAYPVPTPAKVTGYYEPLLHARRRREGAFVFPLYRMPSGSDLAVVRERLGRVPAREDIDGRGALDGLGLELAWLDDPVARFFLHVQGSGRLVFDDASERRVGYAGTNGLAYRAIGGVMVQAGLVEPGNAGAPVLRRWLAGHPAERDDILFRNPRYVFFRDTGEHGPGREKGPVGALGTTLVPGRSVASDDRHVPRGVLAWLRSTTPVVDAQGEVLGRRPMTRFVFASDVGAAIEGEARIDLYEGSGEEAGLVAGQRNEAGELTLLVCPAAGAAAR